MALTLWITCAPAQAGPGYALRFDGTNAFAQGPVALVFNAYPLTVTAWIRTTAQDAQPRGVVSKYADASFNGWSVFLYAGHLRAWYFRDNSDFIWDGSLGLDGGAVADGRWHHVAFVVDASGGRLLVDGVQQAAMSWTGTPGATTSIDRIQFGRYSLYAAKFQGDMDEVSIWNQALGTDAINYVKHRRLGGGEDGLVGLWHFDEGTGTTATDSTLSARSVNLIGAPGWVASTAPVVLSPVAATALSCNGVSDQVVMSNTPAALNAFPITLMAWVKTSQATGAYPTILSKYTGGAGQGYALALNTGRLAPWYFASATNFVEPGFANASDRFIADGQWHHVAFVVDATSGRTFIDGQLVNTALWTGTPGATTTTNDLRLGLYLGGSSQFFNGQMDHVSIWSAALTAAQVNQYSHLPLTGTESGLVSAYEFNEPSGNVALDVTGLANGIAPGGLTRAGSLARVGDGSQYLLGALDLAAYGRLWAIQNSPSFGTFPIAAQATLRRFHDFGPAPGPVSVTATITPTLTDASSLSVPLNPAATYANTVTLDSYNASAPPTATAVTTFNPTLNLDPAAQLQSVSDTYAATVALAHQPAGGPLVVDETNQLALVRWLHFDGKLFFGSIETLFTSVANTPVAGAPDSGGLDTLLAVNNNSGYLPARPDHTYGDGTPLNVILFDNGDALAPSATVNLTGPNPDLECVQNVCFQRSSLTLGSSTLKGFISLLLPAGFSVGINPSNHYTLGRLEYANTLLGTNLLPATDAVVTPGPLYGVHESLPFWFAAPSLTWRVSRGEIRLNPSGGVFVRQDDDDLLTSQQAALVDPSAAIRVSNDAYFRGASPQAGSPLIVTADANGVALVAAKISLNPPELRPHFPYAGTAAGAQIPTAANGLLAVVNSLVDPTNSVLPVSGPVPVAYARQCEDAATCPAAQTGPAVLAFTANGGQLNFTPDGGLLAYGSVPPTNLTWGFVSGNNYAQRTSDVTTGAFCMAGTFLRGDLSAIDDAHRAAELLFTGFGDASNPAYQERPDQADYRDGFANYAGLNFRAPATGRSFLAKTNTGPYPLHPVSKYYVRFGGVNGIHQAASFPAGLVLYGYAFTFTSYGLSFLDSENWESRTDGAIAFPHLPVGPAGFTQEFDRMLLTCRGDLQSAQIPNASGAKHLDYWNVGFTPQSMDFHPLADDPCDAGPRFLVLGVQTQLPFIPQPLSAALGFKPNGNLVTVADGVTNVDSRFPVPAQLSLQGPGTTFFPLSTVTEGYFNNWETPGAAAMGGFYNLAGTLRVPFFSDIKVHLHITPTGGTSATIDIMGGWPAADSTATDLGWSVNNSNYFNLAKFDPNADGWPQAQGVAINDYRHAATTDGKYHPRAQRDWIEVAFFDYPLAWNPVLRNFAGFQDAKVILPVIDVNSRLKQLAPGIVDFDFAQDVSLQLPTIKVLDFVNDALNGNIGPLQSVSNVIRQQLSATLDVTGLNGLSQALREDAQSFFDPVLSVAGGPLDSAVNAVYPSLAALPQTDKAAFLQSVYGILSSPGNAVDTQLRGINGAANQANSVVGSLNQTLTDVQNSLGLFNRVLDKDSSGNRHVVAAIIQKLVQDQGPGLGFVTTLADTQVNSLLADLEPTLAQLQSDLQDASNQVAQVQAALANTSGDFNQALGSVLSDTAGMNDLLKSAAHDTTNYLATVLTPAGDLFTANPDAVKQALRQQLETAFLASALPANYQQTIKGFLYDKDYLVNQLMNTLFDQINGAIRNGLSSFITGAQDGLFQNMKGAGLLSGSLLAAQIRGAPTFDGDSLRSIHLDAAVKMNLPSEMNFDAYMDILELDSQSVPVDCIPAGAPAAEITLGANNVKLDWPGVPSTDGQPLLLTVQAKWTLQGGSVIGIGGLLDVKGQAGFKGCTVKDIGATLAIGELENYFAAKAAGTIVILGIPVDVQAGLFAGHACSLEPLKFIDPEADQVLGNPTSFSGVYIEYGGGLSLSEILFGTSSCLLDVEANETTAIYYMGGPQLGTIGGRQKMAVDVSLLCLVSGHVDWATFIQLQASQLTLGASANVCGSIGPCPFCVTGCKGITVKGVLTTGGIDYHIDY